MKTETPNLDFSGLKNQHPESEIEIVYKRYVNDPVKNELLQQKYDILSRTIPALVHNTETNEFTPIYDPETKKRLEDIDRRLIEHIHREYKDYFTTIE